ncbi:hypothetical protein M0R45_033156 [Rubus argutus]|uniref:Uncharacterized protein n=1 Tax=Rubus argutus TaxID=59490 RepID=A0AAW1WLD3_RUBAR
MEPYLRHDYKEARNSRSSTTFCVRGEISSETPRRAPYAVPTVVVGTLIMFNRSLRRYGVNGFVVRFPNWVHPIQAVRIKASGCSSRRGRPRWCIQLESLWDLHAFYTVN